ncbi:hypothetical protein K439DRAFT_1547294 [Ramaria rubella]|nr:hypothetical protein K439DRAFT_1547294 [Ramaria rubella]
MFNAQKYSNFPPPAPPLPIQCKACNDFLAHGLPTPLEKVPDEVKINFTLCQSLEDRKQAGLDTTLLCGVLGCQMRLGCPRQANHLCERVPRACAPCCKCQGGCKKHPLQAGDIKGLPSPMLASQDSGMAEPPLPASAPQASSTHFARPLPAKYGSAYVANHQARQKRAEDAAA